MQADTNSNPGKHIPAHVPPELVYEYNYISDPALFVDPHARMRELLRVAPPMFYTPLLGGYWVTTSKQLITEIATNPELYSNNSRGIPPVDRDLVLIPLTMDPPQHTVYRMPIYQMMSPKAIARFEDTIRAMSNDLIDKVTASGHCEFLHDIAEPLPVTLFMDMAGMPNDRLQEFRQLAEDATAAPEAPMRLKALERIVAILIDTIKARQEQRQGDIISHLLDADVGGRKPTFEEMQSYVTLLFLGGLETVVNALCFSVRYIALNPDLQNQLRTHPEQLTEAIEELLRLHGIASTIRKVTADTTCHGVQLKKGDVIYLHLPAANFDPQAYDNPDAFIMGRTQNHLTFNTGPHRCIGASLARLELRVFLEEWLRRIPNFQLDPQRPATFCGGMNLAVKSLPLIWSSASAK